MKQSRLMSFLEANVSTFIGMGVAFTSQIVVFPLVGIQANLAQNVIVTAIFTVISIIRQYLVRRLFVWWEWRKEEGYRREARRRAKAIKVARAEAMSIFANEFKDCDCDECHRRRQRA